METDRPPASDAFARLGLSESLTRTLHELGYETPTPIQQQTIPPLLAGRDLIGQAHTGTGKTAAFALPILDRLDLGRNVVQALVLVPTRELAIQVSEAIHTYARHLGRVHVMPVYGGEPIQKQIKRLRGGMHVVVGTPGRIMDHLRRGTLGFEALTTVVLDEADEMLRMGFLEDIEWILEQTPGDRQTALFSATISRDVHRIASRYQRDAVTVRIERTTVTVPTIEQHYLQVSERQKLDVLTRLLETEAAPGEAMLIFVRTKVRSADVAEKLQARGYAVEAMHGDMSQAQRESVIRRIREGQVEIVVATDVAARGLNVEHIGLVVNYDIPTDTESYVHRIGRTGRAGRAGTAILFVTPREGRMLREIERYTGRRLTPMKMPTHADVAARRMALFKERLLKALQEAELDPDLVLVEDVAEESGRDMAEVAAAAAFLARGATPAAVPVEPEQAPPSEAGMTRLFVDAGRRAGVRPGDIVGALANETGIPAGAIGAIDIYDAFTFVDVPAEYRDQVLDGMRGARIRNREANVRPATTEEAAPPGARRRGSAGPFRKKRPLRKGRGGGPFRGK